MSLAQRMAIESPMITATCVEATEFPDLARLHRVTGVPKTVVLKPPAGEDEAAEPTVATEILGAVPEGDFVTQTVQALAGEA